MKCRITRRRWLLMLALFSMTVGLFQIGASWLQPAEANAQISPSRLILRESSSYGMIHGQVSRFCAGTASPNGPAIDWRVRIFGERGDLLLELPEQHSPAGTWHCSFAARDSMDVPGEPGTGRVEMVASVVVNGPSGTDASDIITLLNVQEAGHPGVIQVGFADGSVRFLSNSVSVNVWTLSNSQKLRVSITQSSGDITTTAAKIRIKDQRGNLILEKDLQVPADQFRYVDFSHEELVAAGLNPEPTGDLPFLVELSVVVYRDTNIPSSRDETETVGSNRTINLGAAQSIDVGSGRTGFYRLFGDADGDR